MEESLDDIIQALQKEASTLEHRLSQVQQAIGAINWASIEWTGTRRFEWTGTRWFETQGTQTQRGSPTGN